MKCRMDDLLRETKELLARMDTWLSMSSKHSKGRHEAYSGSVTKQLESVSVPRVAIASL